MCYASAVLQLQAEVFICCLDGGLCSPVPMLRCRGALQAGVLTFLLYLLSTRLDGFFDQQEIPSQLTARNITLTVQTIVRAVTYLFTFICGVNTIGLTGVPSILGTLPSPNSGSEDPDRFANIYLAFQLTCRSNAGLTIQLLIFPEKPEDFTRER